jgi:TRAP transporter TAXI family solute receptor
MYLKKTLITSAAVAGLTLAAGMSVPAGAVEFITIGTGGVTGVYYPTGGAICRLVNKTRKSHGVRCSVESTGGSVYNINTIRAGELDMGIAQSDWQYHAYHGSAKFKKQGAFKNLRAVFSIHSEPLTILARKDAGIKIVEDLKGKRVNIGNPGSGSEATWNVIWTAMGNKNSDLGLVAQMKSAETPAALCDNKIDALSWAVGHPNALTKEATTTCDAVLVTMKNAAITKLIKDNSFYSYATIPGGMYRGNPNDTTTFGVGATFVSSTNTPAKLVYEVVKAVFENFASFKKFHPAFKSLKESDMIKDGLSAPLHDGAIKYYKERGWM